MDSLPSELRNLVNVATALLGEVIRHELGEEGFCRIEKIRQQMADLRGQEHSRSQPFLRSIFLDFQKLNLQERFQVALAFTLLLELINACENAYRTLRLTRDSKALKVEAENQIKRVIYVATSHPTEARSSENISAFHEIQKILINILAKTPAGETVILEPSDRNELRHAIEVAWKAPVVRNRKPKVIDEAESVFSILLRKDVFSALLSFGENEVPFYLRTWVGGDKDGHPGVDEKVLRQSLMLSRHKITSLCRLYSKEIRQTLDLFATKKLQKCLSEFERKLNEVSKLNAGDAVRIRRVRDSFAQFLKEYEKSMGSLHPSLRSLRGIFHIFPALVIPLELRESSDILMQAESSKKPLAIDRMLTMLAKLSKGGDPQWYARGFIISMADSIDHIRAAAKKQKRAFGDLRLPIIPLFEQEGSLRKSEKIVSEILSDSILKKALRQHWGGRLEMLVGYSDSSKEMGVFPSRLLIAETLPKLEKICQEAQVTALFFHGSGGSVDRGGGSIEDQTAWWPASALMHYKVTIQGEMVERSMTTPEIARGQLEHIVKSANRRLKAQIKTPKNISLEHFAEKISQAYQKQIHSPDFLELVEKATSYSYLDVLKIGSRPVKRSQSLTVAGLRAIPWILSWTQTRILFPTWWGVGSAWQASSADEKDKLRRAFQNEPVFSSYVKALGFTLAKVDLAIWFMYLENSVGLSIAKRDSAKSLFEEELRKTTLFLSELTGEENWLWFRPWLGESILLRSSLIHPLNLLQILAHQEKDNRLLRLTVTGISSGMLTTG